MEISILCMFDNYDFTVPANYPWNYLFSFYYELYLCPQFSFKLVSLRIVLIVAKLRNVPFHCVYYPVLSIFFIGIISFDFFEINYNFPIFRIG